MTTEEERLIEQLIENQRKTYCCAIWGLYRADLIKGKQFEDVSSFWDEGQRTMLQMAFAQEQKELTEKPLDLDMFFSGPRAITLDRETPALVIIQHSLVLDPMSFLTSFRFMPKRRGVTFFQYGSRVRTNEVFLIKVKREGDLTKGGVESGLQDADIDILLAFQWMTLQSDVVKFPEIKLLKKGDRHDANS